MPEFTHLDTNGQVRMVDVTEKKPTVRSAVAQARVSMKSETLGKIQDRSVKKGNVLETARIAGIMGTKQTASLIPMCHPLHITHAQIDFYPETETGSIRIEGTVRATDHTGVEMEALTSVSIAALTIYDMCKSHDRDMVISDICLLTKTGGKSGTYKRPS